MARDIRNMNSRPDWTFDQRRPFMTRTYELPPERSLTSVLVLLLLVFFASTYYSARPLVIGNKIWHIVVKITPSGLIYNLEALLAQSRGRPEDRTFKRTDFGNFEAKSKAIAGILEIGRGTVNMTARTIRRSGLRSIGANSMDSPSGLLNSGVFCYENSILQGLASSTGLIDNFKDMMLIMEDDQKFPVLSGLYRMLSLLNSDVYDGECLSVPDRLKLMKETKRQEDAHEYLTKLIDVVEAEISQLNKSIRLSEGLSIEESAVSLKGFPKTSLEGLTAERLPCTRCGHSDTKFVLKPFTCLMTNLGQRSQSSLVDLLDELFATGQRDEVDCINCTLEAARERYHSIIRASSDNEPSPAAIEYLAKVRSCLHMIDEIIRDDTMGDQDTLEKCGIDKSDIVKVTKSQQIAIARPPTTLALHIDRSVSDMYGQSWKNRAPLHFPQVLDLSRWCIGKLNKEGVEELMSDSSLLPLDTTSTEPMLYELRAMTIHQGVRHGSGHFITFRKRVQESITTNRRDSGYSSPTSSEPPADQWFCCDDDTVTKCTAEDVSMAGDVYMLFYEKIAASTTPCSLESQMAAESTSLPQREDSASTPSRASSSDRESSVLSAEASASASSSEKSEGTRKRTRTPDFEESRPAISKTKNSRAGSTLVQRKKLAKPRSKFADMWESME